MATTALPSSLEIAQSATLRPIPLPVRDLRPFTGAGWVVALCGRMQTMPGLPATPAAFQIDVDETGRTVGLH